MAVATTLIDKLLARMIRRGRLRLTHANGETRVFGEPSPGFPEVAIRLADKDVAKDILLDPRLGAGEAFMDGRIIIEAGDIMDLVSLARMNNRWEDKADLAPPSMGRKLRGRLKGVLKSVNRPSSSKANVAHHYDIGNPLYQLMLDAEHMQYSCAYFARDDMTLAQAQEAKLAHIAAKLNLGPDLHVLDIGCGWGGMAIFLASRANVKVTGITLSEEQLALAKERAKAAGVEDKVTFELIDYRDLAASGRTFDRIVSVGMFEHVGRPQFETFFRCCAQLLSPKGTALVHTIGRLGGPGKTDAFTEKWIFPGGYIPALSETLSASQKVRLIATDIETLRLHYAKTIRIWYANCLEHRDEIIALHDERFFRLWTFYLAGAATVFEHGGMCNYQIQFARERTALPLTRSYMEQAEQQLLSRGS